MAVKLIEKVKTVGAVHTCNHSGRVVCVLDVCFLIKQLNCHFEDYKYNSIRYQIE